MRRTVGVSCLVVFLISCAAGQTFTRPSPLVGRPAAVRAADLGGVVHDLDEARGKVRVVDFWATWCDPCRAEMPLLVRLASRYQPRGLQLVTVSCDEPEQEADAAAFVQKHGAPAPHYVRHAANDDKFINSIDRKWSGALPALFLYDRQGRLVKSFVGETDMGALEAAVKQLL